MERNSDMRRYSITAETKRLETSGGFIETVPTGGIKIDEADNGEWVRYEDALILERRIGLVFDMMKDHGVDNAAVMAKIQEMIDEISS